MSETKVIPFIPKAVIEREALIRQARAIYESIFPTTPNREQSGVPYVAPDSDPA